MFRSSILSKTTAISAAEAWRGGVVKLRGARKIAALDSAGFTNRFRFAKASAVTRRLDARALVKGGEAENPQYTNYAKAS
jgi:hypothetical protein